MGDVGVACGCRRDSCREDDSIEPTTENKNCLESNRVNARGFGGVWYLCVREQITFTAGNDSSFITKYGVPNADIWIRFRIKYHGYVEAVCGARLNAIKRKDDRRFIIKDQHWLLGA